ncbi:MAG: hypothetical protein H0V73_02380 [Chloroflexi bacterium]|nr:hypothetical protein [Chloroflexota bacterium]
MFPWWDHLERDRDRSWIMPGDSVLGSKETPFVAIDQNWGIQIWSDGSWIYVVHDGGTGWNTWFRVRLDDFTAAWETGIGRIRSTYAPLSPASVAQQPGTNDPG